MYLISTSHAPDWSTLTFLPAEPQIKAARRTVRRSELSTHCLYVYQNGGTRLLEVLPLDLYFNVQVGVTFSQIAGDYNLELAEFQVSLVFHLYKHAKLVGCVRNGGLTLQEKLPLCASWVKCSVKCGNYLQKKIMYLVLIVIPAPQRLVLIYFSVGNFPTPKKPSRYRLIQYTVGLI